MMLRFDVPDAEGSRMRTLVASIEHEMAGDVSVGAGATRLRASWKELVTLLALGPEPEVRHCPTCGRVGMRDAARCGYCWEDLSVSSPPPAGRAMTARTTNGADVSE
jgi:hypothetical protein